MDAVAGEGEAVARVLGHGVLYVGSYRDGTGQVFAHEFWDEVTGGFTARDLEQAREKFASVRIAFRKPVPVFP